MSEYKHKNKTDSYQHLNCHMVICTTINDKPPYYKNRNIAQNSFEPYAVIWYDMYHIRADRDITNDSND